MYISLYVDVNTFIGGRQPQNKLMRLRTFKKDSALGLALWAEIHQVPSTGCDHTITVGLSQPQPPAPPLLFS